MTARLTRRTALAGGAAAVAGAGGAALTFIPTGADHTPRRLVVVMLRGGLDGMAAVVPYGDPDLKRWRADLVPPEPGSAGGMLDLGGFWGLHPALASLHDLYAAGQLLPIHAVASPDRSRSHFEAQDIMEIGAEHRMATGWLNRVAGLLPQGKESENALAFAEAPPLMLRGPAPVGTWVPADHRSPSAAYYTQVAAMHAADPLTGRAIADGLDERGFTDRVLAGADPAPVRRSGFAATAYTAGRLLAAPEGPRLATLDSFGDWDTHGYQAQRLARPFRELAQGLSSLRSGLDAAWDSTVVMVITEFGRTAKANGSHGTDHGTAGLVLLLGGRVAGGRVLADWPGLGESKLFEGRDVQPTFDLRSIVKGLLLTHLGLDATMLSRVFPGSAAIMPMRGLLRGVA